MKSPHQNFKSIVSAGIAVFILSCLSACTENDPNQTSEVAASFSIAVIPDTQNYLDYKHQSAEGFAIDGSQLFIQQMQYIADHSIKQGGNIAFVASVGDVWQHQTLAMDTDHQKRDFKAVENPYFAVEIEVTDKTTELEIPLAIEGYRILNDTGIPFGVAPGNHDYDAMWSAAEYPPNLSKSPRELTMTPEDLGMLHIGGLDNFRSAFGSNSAFFKDKPWYIGSFNGGANSAQLFSAGGYRFLHFALEMQAADDVLEWVRNIIKDNPGLPTIITTHDYLNVSGQRQANPIVDLDRIDPSHHNSAEELWTKLISQQDQIFLLLCGHQHGQATRIDDNNYGNKVYQVLADYQDRGQVGLDAGQAVSQHTGKPVGLGDGWFRLMQFELALEVPRIVVTTYSSHYQSLSSELEPYAAWYKEHEQPTMTDEQFHASEEFELVLSDFQQRFGMPK
ncbi:MAG: hypothetical protein V7711_17455 [Pseudomonadales bacterium]